MMDRHDSPARSRGHDRPIQRADEVQAMVRRRGLYLPDRPVFGRQDRWGSDGDATAGWREEYLRVRPIRVPSLPRPSTPVLDPWSWYLSTQGGAPDHWSRSPLGSWQRFIATCRFAASCPLAAEAP